MSDSALKGKGTEWVMVFWPETGDFTLRRYEDGRIVESYPSSQPGARERAAIYAAAVIQGFEPPRGLVRQETPAR